MNTAILLTLVGPHYGARFYDICTTIWVNLYDPDKDKPAARPTSKQHAEWDEQLTKAGLASNKSLEPDKWEHLPRQNWRETPISQLLPEEADDSLTDDDLLSRVNHKRPAELATDEAREALSKLLKKKLGNDANWSREAGALGSLRCAVCGAELAPNTGSIETPLRGDGEAIIRCDLCRQQLKEIRNPGLTPQERQVYELGRRGMKQCEIAKKLNVDKSRISQIMKAIRQKTKLN